MRAVITVSRSGVCELLKAMWLAEHLRSLSQHLALHQDLYGGALVDGAAMGAHNLGVEGHLPRQGLSGWVFQPLPQMSPPCGVVA